MFPPSETRLQRALGDPFPARFPMLDPSTPPRVSLSISS